MISEKTHMPKSYRRDIARILTVIGEKDRAAAKAKAKAEAAQAAQSAQTPQAGKAAG